MQIERIIAADPWSVWRYLSDVAHWHDLLPTVTDVERVGAIRPTGVGSRFRVRQPGLAAAVYEVTEWRPGEAFVWEADAPGVRTIASHEVRQEGAGTRLILRIEWRGAFAGLVRLLFNAKSRRYVETEAATFAALAEAKSDSAA